MRKPKHCEILLLMTNLWKIRIDKTIYGLLYPAFFGNMIYDLILRKLAWSDADLVYPDIFSCLAIAGFAIVDFMHLNGDMNEIIKRPENKSKTYLICDIFTPMLIFLCFVLIKEKTHLPALLLLSIIPWIIFLYKRRRNKKSKEYFRLYAIISNIFFSVALLIPSDAVPIYSLGYTILSLFGYTYFVFSYYPTKCLQDDVDYMAVENNIY